MNDALNEAERRGLDAALDEARAGLAEGGIPIGSALLDAAGQVVARGHNLRVQTGDPTAHAEVACIRHAGRRRDWSRLTLVSTLSPCIMCTGTALLLRVPRVVIGESRTFRGAEELFEQHGAALIHADDKRCVALMRDFIAARPDLWHEDIGDPPPTASPPEALPPPG
jgi:cytosine deaminase